jgi:hypothetical protein
MEQREGHIVSTLSWETTFDDKALGFDLQNRISQWSKFVMPGELDEVFKQACPEGMALSINSLEIDLGEIEVKDLEAELKKRLETTLKEKLADMLSYPSHNQNLKLTEQSLASMDSLRYFLVNGVMPWNYTGGDLNVLVSDLFKKQQQGTVDLLRETGTASIEARKRMAWQFDEPNMNETIRGFEPVSYGQITSLSGEMVRLQHKEQFIRSSVADLGKEIRLWILNYLLSDRGTLFNNLAFMKGILEQMAHRHNIAYSDLLLLVEKAIVKPNLAYHVKGEFITVINMLSQQHKSLMPGQGNKNPQQGISPNEYKGTVRSDAGPEQLAANIILAGYENSHSSLLALPNNIDYWLKHANRLDERFMSLFFSACRYAWPSKVVKLVEFFTELPGGAIPQISKEKIRAISVAYLLIYNENIDRKAFFKYLLNQCAKITGKGRREVYDEFATALVALKLPGAVVNDVYELMGAVAETVYTRYDTEPFAGIIRNLNRYCLQLVDKGTDRRMLGLLRQDLGTLVKSDPRGLLRTLRALKNKAVLFYSVPLLSSGTLINLLLDTDRGPVWKAMNVFKTALHEISAVAGRNEIVLLERTAMRLAFKALILQPVLIPMLFFKELADEAERSGKFNSRCLTLLKQQLGIEQTPVAGSGGAWRKMGNSHDHAIAALIYEQLLDVKKGLPAVLDTLHQHRANEPLIRMIRNDGQLVTLLFNRSFNNGNHEVKVMITNALSHILKATPRLSGAQTEQKLNELFWQCFIGGGWYRHGFAGLKNNFKAAVNYHYNTTAATGAVTSGTTTGNQGEQLHYAEIISAKASPFKFSELADAIKIAISAGADTVIWNESPIGLTEILFHVAVEQGQDPLKMAAKLTLSDNEIIAFMRTVDFEHFLYLFTINKPALAERIGDLALIFFLLNTVAPRSGNNAAMVDLYKRMLALNGQQGNWRSGRDLLLGDALAISLPKLSAGDQLINKLNAAGFKLSADLRAVFSSLASGQHRAIGKFNTAGFKFSAGLRTLFSTLATGQHKSIDKLNAADLKLPVDRTTTQGPTIQDRHKPADKLNAAELKLYTDKRTTQGPTIPDRYKPVNKFDAAGLKLSEGIRTGFGPLASGQHKLIGKLNAAELKLSADTRTMQGPTIPGRYKLVDKFDAAELKLSADLRTGFGPFAYGQHKLIGKLNVAELKLSANTGALSDPTVLGGHQLTDGSMSPEETGMMDNSSATGKQTQKSADTVKKLSEDIANAHQKGVTEQLLYLVITEQLIPTWFNAAPGYSAGILAEQIIHRYPGTLLNILKSGRLDGQELEQFAQMLPFQRLVVILADQNSPVKQLATEITYLYKALGSMSFGTIPGRQVQALLYKKLLIAWKSANWTLLSASRIWQELIWDMFVTYKVSKDNFIRQVALHTETFAPGYRAALQQLVAVNVKGAERTIQIKDPSAKKKPVVSNIDKILTDALPVKNAGMVLLSEYVPALFRHMGLLAGQAFLNADARIDAVHILQYAVTGMKETSEPYLPLNKVLCGLPLAEPVTPGITLDEPKEKLIGGMLLNLVSQWEVIGKTSVDGFRGNWLVRDGLLSEWEDKWELVVEPRPYDILINQFPFSYSIIKYQWMDKPLHVKWKI